MFSKKPGRLLFPEMRCRPLYEIFTYLYMSLKTTLISHIFNEEYLLPFWLTHHKNMFDEIIIVDYNSTDKSIEICKSICPECKIIKTQNEYFDAVNTDIEIMNIENNTEGIKIVLNTTEFLFIEVPIKDLFVNERTVSYSINAINPYSKNTYEINNIYELFKNLLNSDVLYHSDRGPRQLHNYNDGNYGTGRHHTSNPTRITNKAHIIWFGFYPMNENLLKRKLQIQQNMSERDKELGFGVQHLFSKEKILCINTDKSSNGQSLININPNLYNLLISTIIPQYKP